MASHRNFTPSLESLKRSTDRVFAVRPGEPVGFKPSPLGGQSVTAPTEGTWNRTLDRREIGMPLAACVWFDMRTTPNLQAAYHMGVVVWDPATTQGR